MTLLAVDAGSAFPPELARFGQTLHRPDPTAVPVSDLLRPDALFRAVAPFAAEQGGANRRAVLSMWSQHYLLALVPAALATCLLPCSPVPLTASALAVRLARNGLPTAFCLRASAPPYPVAALDRFAALLHGHLIPLANALHAVGLPPRVFWGNAAAKAAWTVGVAVADPVLLASLRRALSADRCPCCGGSNPFGGLLTPDGQLRRQACCLRRRLPGLSVCASCPATARVASYPATALRLQPDAPD